MILIDLLIGFLKVGFFAFGGAYGAIPLIRDVVLSYGWLSDERLTDMIAVSESTPGPIMVNLATYVGSSQAGLPGALVATLAVVLPSFFIILLLTVLLKTALKNKYAAAVLGGLTPCVIGIVLATGCVMVIRQGVLPLLTEAGDSRPLILSAGLALVYFGSRKILKKGLRRPDPDFRLCGDRDVRCVRNSDAIRFSRRGYRKDGGSRISRSIRHERRGSCCEKFSADPPFLTLFLTKSAEY